MRRKRRSAFLSVNTTAPAIIIKTLGLSSQNRYRTNVLVRKYRCETGADVGVTLTAAW